MSTVTLNASGKRSADDVWERYESPAMWSSWAPQIRSVTCDRDRIAVGLAGRVHPWLGPALSFVVTAVDEARRTWSWRVGLGPVALDLDHRVVVRQDATLSSVTFRGPLVVIVPYLPLAQVALWRLVGRPEAWHRPSQEASVTADTRGRDAPLGDVPLALAVLNWTQDEAACRSLRDGIGGRINHAPT